MASRPRFLPSIGGRRVQSTSMTVPSQQKALLERYFADLSQASTAWTEGGSWTMEKAMREGYSRVVWVWRSVEAISGNSSRLKYRLREGQNVIDDHPNYRVINGKANPLETGRMLRKRLSAQVLLSPRGAFVETTKSRRGDLLRLDLAPPGRTRPVPGKGADVISHFVIEPFSYGQKERHVEVENMRWVREAHPTDPYGASTPLEAIGLSVELDHFARLYNASFMRNDGRPGGILGIKGDVEEWEMDRVEARFGGGPLDAGRLSVVAGDLDYVDVAKTPRDAQYVQSSSISKTEILVGFGVPESVIGNASGKTFANAEAEEYAFWTVTMLDHNDLIVTAFDEDSEDDLEGFLDTSKVEVLQRPDIARREEARKEFAAGLRSLYSYAQLAGIDDIESTPATRALWIGSSVIAVAANEADTAALAATTPGATPPAAPEAPAPGGAVAVDQAATPPGGFMLPPTRSAAALPAGTTEPGRSEVIPDGAATPRAAGADDNVLPFGQKGQPVPAFTVAYPRHGETPEQAVERLLREQKAADLGDADDGPVSRVDPLWRGAAETAIASRLETVAGDMTGVIAARLRSQKSRKGTRHWQPEYAVDTRIGEKALDSVKIVDGERWASACREALEPFLRDLCTEAAALVVLDLGLDPDSPEGKALSRRLANLVPAKALPKVLAAAQAALRLIEVSAERRAALFADLISEKENEGLSLADIIAAVKALGGKGEDWAKGLALHATTAAVEGARDALVEHYADPDIMRRWRSQRDGKVRPTHVKADGQEQKIGEPFEVGTALLRFPGDPDAPMSETANCRCYLIFRSRSTGQFRARPAGQRDRKSLPVMDGHVRCRCCEGFGEHDTGRECYRCDASGNVTPREDEQPVPCDGTIDRKGLITGTTLPRSICPGCGDTVEFTEDGWARLDGSYSHDTGEDGNTHSDVMEPPEAKHLPGRHDQGSHGNLYRAKPGAVALPTGRWRKGDRELVRAGRARLYGVTPPPLLNGRDPNVPESYVTDSVEDAERYTARSQMLDAWDEVPPGVTEQDIAEWRGEWVDEFPDTHPDEDAEKFAALDDAFIAGWAAEWHSRPWIMDDDGETEASKARVEAAREAAAKIKEEQEVARRAAARAAEDDPWGEDARVSAEDLERRREEGAGEPILGRTRKPRTAEQEAREQYDLYVQNALEQAVQDTNAAIFSKEGKRLKINDMSLFTGRLTRRYASEELLEWWTRNPRLTWTQFRAQALGRDSDRRRGQNRRTYTGVE